MKDILCGNAGDTVVRGSVGTVPEMRLTNVNKYKKPTGALAEPKRSFNFAKRKTQRMLRTYWRGG